MNNSFDSYLSRIAELEKAATRDVVEEYIRNGESEKHQDLQITLHALTVLRQTLTVSNYQEMLKNNASLL